MKAFAKIRGGIQGMTDSGRRKDSILMEMDKGGAAPTLRAWCAASPISGCWTLRDVTTSSYLRSVQATEAYLAAHKSTCGAYVQYYLSSCQRY